MTHPSDTLKELTKVVNAMLKIVDPDVIEILCTAMEDRIVGLEMVADTQQAVGDAAAVRGTLREWARARAALRLLRKG